MGTGKNWTGMTILHRSPKVKIRLGTLEKGHKAVTVSSFL